MDVLFLKPVEVHIVEIVQQFYRHCFTWSKFDRYIIDPETQNLYFTSGALSSETFYPKLFYTYINLKDKNSQCTMKLQRSSKNRKF